MEKETELGKRVGSTIRVRVKAGQPSINFLLIKKKPIDSSSLGFVWLRSLSYSASEIASTSIKTGLVNCQFLVLIFGYFCFHKIFLN